jgi:hypothetical protein
VSESDERGEREGENGLCENPAGCRVHGGGDGIEAGGRRPP